MSDKECQNCNPASDDGAWHVYLVRCADGTLYCGIARDVARRLAQHNGLLSGGARYTRGGRPVVLEASLACSSRPEALRLEARVKKMARYDKLAFFSSSRKS